MTLCSRCLPVRRVAHRMVRYKGRIEHLCLGCARKSRGRVVEGHGGALPPTPALETVAPQATSQNYFGSSSSNAYGWWRTNN